MLKGFIGIYLRELLIIRNRGVKMLLSIAISPILYLIAFGYGIGKNIKIGDINYIDFLIPGLIAMSTMTQSFNISSEINITRFYWKIFEEIQASPVNDFIYVLAEILTGITKSLITVFIIIFIGFLAGSNLNYNLAFWIAILLNSYLFSSIAVLAAMTVKTHADQAMLSNFIIFPMAFLGGTIFPLENLPYWAELLLKYLPISIASNEIRSSALNFGSNINSFYFLAILGIFFMFLAYKSVKKARD